MNSRKLNKRKHLLCLTSVAILLVLTGYFLFKNQDLSQLPTLLVQTDIKYILLGLLAIIIFFALETRAIQILLQPTTGAKNFFSLYKYSLIDFYFSSITPGCSGGQPSQLYYMHRDNIPIGASSLAVLTFNMAYHVAVLLIAAATLFLSSFEILDQFGPFKYLLILGIIIQSLITATYFSVIFHKNLAMSIISAFIKLFCKLKIIKNKSEAMEKATAQIEEYRRGAQYMKDNPLLLIRTLLIAILHLIVLYSIPFWVYKAFGLSGYSFWYILAVQATLTLSIESLPIPGGIGVTESGFMLIYSGIFGANFVIPALLVYRSITYYLGLLSGGLISSISLRPKKNQIKAKKIIVT